MKLALKKPFVTVQNAMLKPAIPFVDGYTVRRLEVDKRLSRLQRCYGGSDITCSNNHRLQPNTESNYIYKSAKLNTDSE